MTARKDDEAIDELAQSETGSPVCITDAQQQHPARGKRRACAAQYRFLGGGVGVMQHVEDDDRIDRAVVYVTDVALDETRPLAEGRPGPSHLAAVDIDPEQLQRFGCGRPVARPPSLELPRLRGQQPRGQQPLAATEIQNARTVAEQPSTEDRRKSRVARELCAGEVPGKSTCRAVAAAGGLDERPHQWVAHVQPCRNVTGLRPASRTAERSAGSTSRMIGAPALLLAACPSCSSRMSPAPRERVRRPSTCSRLAETVSNPRRVQLTSSSPARASSGSRNGLRRPAGARKKRGVSPVAALIDSCARAISARIPRGPRSEKRSRWR